MEIIHYLIDFILNLETHLDHIIETYNHWTYLLLFLIIFCETGLVITPFLPGDSLLFAIGAFVARGALDLTSCLSLLVIAAFIGDTVNYSIGKFAGPRVFHYENNRLLNPVHLKKAHAFYERYGGKTIIIARFIPIIRTFAPFVAGIGTMSYRRFMLFNLTGGILWVFSFILLGYYFGNMPAVKSNFKLVILAIIIISVMPAVVEFIREKYRNENGRSSS